MGTFTVIVHPEPKGGFWGEVPSLPRCYSQGETVEELLSNMREAIGGTLEVMRQQGVVPEAGVQVMAKDAGLSW